MFRIVSEALCSTNSRATASRTVPWAIRCTASTRTTSRCFWAAIPFVARARKGRTFLTSLKLAQFDFLSRTGARTTPLLLLDDIFDKLDARRVEQIVKLVSGERFGQIFITDTNRDHMDAILSAMGGDNRLFHVEKGVIGA